MKERLNRLVSGSVKELTIGTFHAICARILRRDGRATGIDPTFVIYDEEDQLSLIKRSIQEVGLDPKQYAPRAIASAISAAKSRMLAPDDYIQRGRSYFDEVVGRVYELYQQKERQQRDTQRNPGPVDHTAEDITSDIIRSQDMLCAAFTHEKRRCQPVTE